jgi:hypothetical protein
MVTRVVSRLAGAAAILGAVGTAVAPQPAHALGPWAAAGIGVGAFALGSTLAAPYYWGYPGYYGYPAYYYPPAPPAAPYYPAYPRSCWNPYYRTYVTC